MNNALHFNPDTGDLNISGGRLVIGQPQGTITEIVTVSNRGELKEQPLIGGEAYRQLGAPKVNLWLTRLRKMLTAVGLSVTTLAMEQDGLNIETE